MSNLQSTLTKKQKTVFALIQRRIREFGTAPTIREIAEEMGFLSPNGVICHLRALEKKGLIHREKNKSRSISVTAAAADELRGLPLLGVVQAGALMEAVEQNERIDVGGSWRERGCFALRVAGDSMIDAQIAPGDFVIVRPRKTAERGDMVVARTSDGEATLKFWYPERNRVRLEPANKSYKPIFSKDVRIIGVVVGVVREFKR
jgi:repressor LexA